MSQAKQTGAKIRARVLVSGAHGRVDDVIEIDEEQVKSMAGVVDINPASVAYAESLAGHQDDEAPSLIELFAARDTLMRREAELNEQSERVRVQAADNLTEAGRLADLRAQLDADAKRLADDVAQLASDKAAFEAAKAAAPVGKGKAAAAA